MPNIFSTPQELKQWAIELANACGGAKVYKSKILAKANPEQANKLLERFAVDYNDQVVQASKETDSTVVFQGKEVELEEE
jgi:hypothetical protein